MRQRRSPLVRVGVAVLATALAMLAVPTSAHADTAPAAGVPATVSADALPTVQIDGVAWTQLVVGNTVYVGGSFTTARPAGAAAGTNTTARSNLLAYDIRTGELITSWAPVANGDVLTIKATPDGTKLYLGGQFTRIDGQVRNRIARVDAVTGALDPTFQPKSDASVYAIAPTATTVYFGGLTTNVNGVARNRLAAVQASDGALLSWAPNAQGGRVRGIAVSPDGAKIVVGGQFTSLNGTAVGGLGAVSATGATVGWAGNSVIKAANSNSSITQITATGTDVYVTAFGSSSTFEGVSRMRWSDGAIVWVADCHGDTYDSFVNNDVVYLASHAHYCGNMPGGFPQTDPGTSWTFHHATAMSTAVGGTLTADIKGYKSYAGQPAPTLLKWQPVMATGTFTGQGQASWSVAGNGSYAVYGGEFPTVNNQAQQGLVRFAVRAVAPNTTGPVLTGSKIIPTLKAAGTGAVDVTWSGNWDRDNENLTYKVIRDGNTTTPVYSVTAPWAYGAKNASVELAPQTFTFKDTGLTPGDHRYRIFVTDPLGNEARSDTVNITLANTPPAPPVASFTTSASGRTVRFDGRGSTAPAGTVASYAWSFGDGSSGTGAQATKTYSRTGTYTVSLTVTDSNGATNTVTRSVRVRLF